MFGVYNYDVVNVVQLVKGSKGWNVKRPASYGYCTARTS
jgi:hypothetical protein